MLRIRFTPDDLVRVRVSDAIDPMWEIVGSIQVLQLGASPRTLMHSPWLKRARTRLKDPGVRAAARVMATAAPYRTYFPDFLTPDRHTQGFDDDLDAVLSTPVDRLSRELLPLRGQASWLHGMAAGDPRALTGFGDAVRRYHEGMLAPDDAQFDGALSSHRAKLWRRMMSGGTEEMLAGLGSTIRWRPPYLEARYPVPRTVDLRGRGLLLVPSYFCVRMPTTFVDPDLNPVLVYPIDHAEVQHADPTGNGLAELIGSTRAAVLESLAEGASTTDVARRVGISVATASHHTAVLRDAGLITSTRLANRMMHSLSTLGSVFVTSGDEH